MRRILGFGFLVLTATQAAELGPQIEIAAPWDEDAPFTGKELERIKAGFSPPVFSSFFDLIPTSGEYLTWDQEEKKMGWGIHYLKWYYKWYPTSPSIRETPPQFTDCEGMRILRMSNNGECQLQSSYVVVQVEKLKMGWAVTRWNSDDTVLTKEKGWRTPIPGRVYRFRSEIHEVRFDNQKRIREVVTKFFEAGSEGKAYRQVHSESGKRSQAITEAYRGTEIVPEKMVSKSMLQRTRLAQGWQYEQLVSKDILEDDGTWKSTQKNERWEILPDGSREPLKGEKL